MAVSKVLQGSTFKKIATIKVKAPQRAQNCLVNKRMAFPLRSVMKMLRVYLKNPRSFGFLLLFFFFY